jgi:hypothetical protein
MIKSIGHGKDQRRAKNQRPDRREQRPERREQDIHLGRAESFITETGEL